MGNVKENDYIFVYLIIGGIVSVLMRENGWSSPEAGFFLWPFIFIAWIIYYICMAWEWIGWKIVDRKA